MQGLLSYVGRALAATLLLTYVASGLYQVAADESAVALRLGRVVGRDVLPGMHWNPPWPFGRVVIAQTATSFIMPIGYRFQPRPDVSPISDMWLTGDTNVITARMIVQYRIKSLTDFVLSNDSPRELVRRTGERALAELLAGEGVDGVLTTRRNTIPTAVRERVQEVLDQLEAGIDIQSVNIEEFAPPVQGGVRGAFQDVQNAKSDRERLIHEARAQAAQSVAEAKGEADRIVNAAAGSKRARTEEAGGRSRRFAALAAQHATSPALTEERLFLETMEKVLGRTRNFVVEPGPGGSVKLRVLR